MMKLLIVVTIIIFTIGCATAYYLGMDYNTFHQKNADNITFIIESQPSRTGGAFFGIYNWKNGKRIRIGWGTDKHGIPRISGYIIYDRNNNVIARVR